MFNSHFAKCSNLPLISVNQAEKRFLSAIEWEIFVDPPQFFKQLVHLEKLMMQSECKKRSFSSLTYSELRRFLNDHDLKTMSSQIVQRLLHSMFLFLLGYSVLVLSVTLSTVCLLQIEQFANHIKVIQTASSQMSNHHWTSNSAGLSNSIEPPLYSQIELHQTMSNNHIKLHSDRSRPATFHSVFIHSNDINHILAQNWTRHASLRLSKPIGLTYNYDLVNPFSWFMIRL